MNIWRRERPVEDVEVPTPRTEVPMEGPTEGELARKRAEEALGEIMARTRQVQAETAWWEAMGERIGRLRERNHIREDILLSMKGGR